MSVGCRSIAKLLCLTLLSISPAALQAAQRQDIARISAGSGFTCATTVSGGAICWGSERFGELGNGSEFSIQPSPVNVIGLSSGVEDTVAGGGHACALTTGGAVKCWGFNLFGQLGDGTTLQRLAPVNVVGLSSGVFSVAAGFNHTCALTTTGGVKCWGANSRGELGDGTTTDRLTPVEVVGLSSGVLAIRAGVDFTCALTAATGVKCWGRNDQGQLGDGTIVDKFTPVDVAGLGRNVSSVSTGWTHACAVLQDGSLRCWGANESGQLGDGTFDPRLMPNPVGSLGPTVVSVSAGEALTCALVDFGGVKCWGGNGSGELGDGTRITRPLPAFVSGLTAGATEVSAGRDHACAVMSDSTARCWGYDAQGATGDGSAGLLALYPSRVGTLTSQTVTFPPVGNRDIELGPLTLSATASSGLPVAFTSQTPSVCTISGTTLTPVAIGLCAIYATQPGDATYATSDYVQRTILVFGSPAGAASRLRSISTRASARQGNEALIGGFIIDGAAPKTVLIRAIGPSLTGLGVSNALADPFLQLYSRQVVANDNWQLGPNPNPDGDLLIGPDPTLIQSIGFNPANPLESALLMTLLPGPYTAIAYGADGGSGVALIEVIEIDRADAPLAGISSRGRVGTGEEVMIGGFVIEGSQPLAVAVRARGPSLAGAGVQGTLANPVLTLVRASDGAVIAINDDWQTAPNAAQLQASGFAPTEPSEAAVLMTLPPGAYTAIVSGAGGTTGVAIVEVFAAD